MYLMTPELKKQNDKRKLDDKTKVKAKPGEEKKSCW
jgi:hypothetical protein